MLNLLIQQIIIIFRLLTQDKGMEFLVILRNGDLTNGVGSTSVNSDSVALRGWWRPENTGTAVPSISVGYDAMSFSGRSDVSEGRGYFVGLNWADMIQPDDRIGLALGQPMKATETPNNGISSLGEVEPLLCELYYSFKPNDSMQITPAVFGGRDVHADTADDIFGAVVSTTFKF